MNKEIEELVDQIIKAIEQYTHMPLSEEEANKIRNAIYALPKKPQLLTTKDPKEFDSYARLKDITDQGTFGKKQKTKTVTTQLYGNYTPGISRIRYLPNNRISSDNTHTISDFAMDQLQIVLSIDYRDENSNWLVIYGPDSKNENLKGVRFKDFIKNEQKQTLFKKLKEATNGKVSDEQLQVLVDKFDFSNGIPEIEIISDPKTFDIAATNFDDEYSRCEVDVLLNNNCKPGREEDYVSSDFNLNEVQIVLVKTEHYHRFNNTESGMTDYCIKIYVPEKEYPEKTYKELDKKNNSAPRRIQYVDVAGYLKEVSRNTTETEVLDTAASVTSLGQKQPKGQEEQK